VAGTLDKVELQWSPMASVCVVMASAGYPGSVMKGKVIHGLEEAGKVTEQQSVPCGNCEGRDGDCDEMGDGFWELLRWVCDIRLARQAAYAGQWRRLRSRGAQWRTDIGSKAITGVA